MENSVGLVKGSFFKVRRFHDRANLEAQLVAWLIDVNTVRRVAPPMYRLLNASVPKCEAS